MGKTFCGQKGIKKSKIVPNTAIYLEAKIISSDKCILSTLL